MNGSQSESLDVQFDRSGRQLTVYLTGELDDSNASEFERQLLGRVDTSVEEAWLDLSMLTSCDANGLQAFEVLHQHINSHGGRVVLYQPSGDVDRVLGLSGLDQIVHVIGRRSADAQSG